MFQFRITGAGTNADVWVQLMSSSGSTHRASLAGSEAERKEKFERGEVDHFVVEGKNVGMPTTIKVGLFMEE